MRIIFAQISGLLASISSMASVHQNKKIKMLGFQILSNFLFVVQYIFLGALAGASVYLLSIFRCYIFYQYEKLEKKKSLLVLTIFIIITIFSGMLCYQDIFSIIPIITAVLYTYAVWQNNLKIFRVIAFIVPVAISIYNFYVGAYVGALSAVIEAVSSFTAIIRFDIIKNKICNMNKELNANINNH